MSATHSRTWKKFESRIATFFGTVRRSLSGSDRIKNGDKEGDDCMHDDLYIECKYRGSHPLINLYNLCRKQAPSMKTVVIAIQQKGQADEFLLMDKDELLFVALQRLKAIEQECGPGCNDTVTKAVIKLTEVIQQED